MSSNTITTKPIIVSDGWLSNARQVPSPNYNTRPQGESISLLVIHNISLPPEQFGNTYIEQFFCNQLDCSVHPYFQEIADLQVSSHLLITRTGELIQFVPFELRAWHAGASCFNGRDECNNFSIGIELEGTDTTPYTDEQYAMLAKITPVLTNMYPDILLENIVGHCDIAPERKTDPGPAFDWERYQKAIRPNK